MSIFTNVNNANGMPKWVLKASGVGQGYNPNSALTFANGSNQGVVIGLTAAVTGGANTNKYHHAGWTKIQRGVGPVVAFAVNAAGSLYSNGETVTVSNGVTNATGVIVTNATGNIVSVVPRSGGTFQSPNVALTVLAYNQEKHLVNIVVGGTPTGYTNGDIIVASNGIALGTATFSTNSTGGFVSGNVTITNPGVFGNTAANNTVVFTVVKADGVTPTSGSGATFTANIAFTGTGANVTVSQIGGKAGRVGRECLVAMGSMTTANAAADYANLP